MKHMISSSLYPDKIDINPILQMGKPRHKEIQPCPKPHNWQAGGPGLEPIKGPTFSFSLLLHLTILAPRKCIQVGLSWCCWSVSGQMNKRERRKNVVQRVSAGTALPQCSRWLRWAVGRRFGTEHPLQPARQSVERPGAPQGVGVFIGSEHPMGNFPPKFQFPLCQDKW